MNSRSHAHLRGKGSRRVNPQQLIFELKHQVVIALNKLADRDTYQIGADELERIAENLMPEGLVPFLSCVIDTDSEQKSAVRKECVRIMGTLARIHGSLLTPHLGKIVGSIIKRLKDPDSVVRDACVEAVVALSLKLSSCGDESGGIFVVLVKPLFEALGDQNRQVQSGSALCLAGVIDNANNPPVALLMRMLTRVIKFLKSQNFMAKPALIDLVRSVIQAGGASTEQALSGAVTSIQESLKSNDWATRKAASMALRGIAASGGPFLSSVKSSCILSLESCRFDKVKPVRDSVIQAIQCWKRLSVSDYLEPSEAGSSTKENFCGDYADHLTHLSEGGWKGNPPRKVVACTAMSGMSTNSTKRNPLASRETFLNYVQSPCQPKMNDWNIEIALPRTHTASLADTHNEESEGSCVTKTFEGNANASKVRAFKYDYAPMDDKPESYSISDFISSSVETKRETIVNSSLGDGDSVKTIRMNHMSPSEETNSELHKCSLAAPEHKRLDSTVAELSSQGLRGCCLHTANELAFIRKKLLEIESKQSSLLDLVQVFIGDSMDNMSMLQSKVLGLEHAVDKIVRNFTHCENYSKTAISKGLKNNESVSSSPRFSTCTPRPSVDTSYRKPLVLSKNRELRGETAFARSRSSTSIRQVEMWRDSTLNIIKNPIADGVGKHVGCNFQSRKAAELPSVSPCASKTEQNILESKNSLWNRIKDFLCVGDLDTAFVEALCSGNDLILIELMDRTGPVLEMLSRNTISDIVSTISAHLLDQRFLDSIIPWLHQVVELSVTQEPNCLGLSVTERKELLSAIQEAAAMDFCDPVDRRSIKQLALKLRQVWVELVKMKDLEA